MLFTADGQLLSSIKKDWEFVTAKVETPRDLFEPANWEDWKTYASALPLEKQIAKLQETIGDAHGMWMKKSVGAMTQNEKLEIYSAFTAAEFLIHRLHIRLDYSAPVDQLYGTDRAAYDKLIGPREDRMLYHVGNTLKELGVSEDKLEEFAHARARYLDLVSDEAFMQVKLTLGRQSLELGNSRLRAEREKLKR